MPDAITSREALRIGGGYQAPATGASPAGGLDIDAGGNVAASGDLTVDGLLAAGSPPQAFTNAAGQLDGARLQSASVAPSHLNPTASYTLGALAVGGLLRLVKGADLALTSTGTVSPIYSFHFISTDVDNRTLHTIQNAVDGALLLLCPKTSSSSFTITYTGNIKGPAAGVQLEHRDIFIQLIYWTDSWHVIAHNGAEV
jgi:hypothetical protein